MSKRVIRQVWGVLAVGGQSQNVKLNLTVVELMGNSPMPDGYALERTELTPMSGMTVQDGEYVLRFNFNGRTEEHAVRVQDGVLMNLVGV